MSYREEVATLHERIADLERRMRRVEQPGTNPPDPGWVMTQVGTSLHYLYVPTGALGVAIGTQ